MRNVNFNLDSSVLVLFSAGKLSLSPQQKEDETQAARSKGYLGTIQDEQYSVQFHC